MLCVIHFRFEEIEFWRNWDKFIGGIFKGNIPALLIFIVIKNKFLIMYYLF